MSDRSRARDATTQSDSGNKSNPNERSPAVLSPEQSEFARVIGRLLADEWEARGAGGQPEAVGRNSPSAAGQ
jgi:hypothetical protein